MIRKSKTNDPKSSTQLLEELLPNLRTLLKKLEETENESDSLIQYAYDNHLISIFENDIYLVKKNIKRIYYNR